MTNQVPLVSPIKGVVRAVAREGQPPETCWDAQNVLPYDRYGRKRLAQRGGLLKQYPNQMAAATDGNQFVQGMIEAPNIIYPPNSIGGSIPGVSDISGFVPALGPPAATIGPFPGPGTTVPFSPWAWSFTVQAAGSAPDTNCAGVWVISWLTVPTIFPTPDYGFVTYINARFNGSVWQCKIAFYEGDIPSAPVPNSGPSWPPAGTGILLQFPDISNQAFPGAALWNFRLEIDSGGNYTLFDLTDITSSSPNMLAVLPTLAPSPSVISERYYDAGGSSDAIFTLTD